MHSVEKTEWRETYAVDREGKIVLTASDFASAGAGLPDRVGPGETFRAHGGRMRIEGRCLPIQELRVRLSEVSHHVLRIGNRNIDLNALFGECVVSIRVEQ